MLFTPIIAADLKKMDKRLFMEENMGVKEDWNKAH
jgi:acyl CoA:acetate/3-ketoacid CoA transferase